MIRYAELRDSLADLIKKKAGLNLLVFFNFVANSSEDYIFVNLIPRNHNIGGGLTERFIRIDFQVVLTPENGMVRRADLYEMADKLFGATAEPLQVTDRFLTIYDAEMRIFDGIMTFTFKLDFADGVDYLPSQMVGNGLMQKLEMEMK